VKLNHAQQLAKMTAIVKELQGKQFYGQVTLDIQAGNILLIRKQETVKLEEVSNGNARKVSRPSGRQDQEAPEG